VSQPTKKRVHAERILPNHDHGQLCLALEPVTAGSTPVAQTLTYAGIVKVKRYAFSMP